MMRNNRNVSFYGPSRGLLGGDPITRDYMMDPRRQMAQQLMAQGSSTAPVQSNLEGLTRALTAGVGGYFGNQADQERKGREAALNKDMAVALGAYQGPDLVGGPGTPPSAKYQGDVPSSGTAGVIKAAIASGNKDMGPFIQKMQMQQMAQDQARQLLDAGRSYNEDQSTLAFDRSLATEKMKRGLSLQDKAAELDIRNRNAMARDAAKPWAAAGLTPPMSGAGIPQGPQMSLVDAQAAQAGAKARAVEIGKEQAKAISGLPMIEHNSKYLIDSLDAVLAPKMDASGNPIIENGRYVPGKEHPGLENSVGLKSGGAIFENLPYDIGGPISGTDAADFTAKLQQVTGKQFLQAFETLKGGGQITEVEGTKATQALANLSTEQTESQFRSALLQFRYEVGELVKIAKQRTGQGQQQSPATSEDQDAIDWARANPNDPRAAAIMKFQGE